MIYFSDFGTPGGGDGYISGESLAEATFTGASVDAVTIDGSTLKASTNYYLFASVDCKSSSTSSYPTLNVLNGATQLTTSLPRYQPDSANDYRNQHFVRRVTTSANPASDSWILQVGQGGSGATVTWKNARLVLLEAGADDAYAESRAAQTFTSPGNASSQTAVSLTFTPGSAGDYVFLGFLVGNKGNTINTNFVMELTDGTTTTGEHWARCNYTNERTGATLPLFLSGISGSKTITLKVREQGTGSVTIGCSDACIIAIRTDRFANLYRDQDTSTGSPITNASYQATNVNQTFTPAAADHIVIAGGMFGGASGATAQARVDDGGTTLVEPAFVQTASTVGQNSPFLVPRIAAYTASSRTQKIDHKATSGEVNTWQPFIFTFDLTGI